METHHNGIQVVLVVLGICVEGIQCGRRLVEVGPDPLRFLEVLARPGELSVEVPDEMMGSLGQEEVVEVREVCVVARECEELGVLGPRHFVLRVPARVVVLADGLGLSAA